MRRRNPFDFSFERPRAYGRHARLTMSPSDPNPDVQQDDNYADARRAWQWQGPWVAVRALVPRVDSKWRLVGLAVIGGAARHIALQFWDGLDPAAFAGVVLTALAIVFREHRVDDARYGGLHSVLWFLAVLFVVGRLVAVYLNLYPSSLPWLGAWAVNTLVTGAGWDGWLLFVFKAPLEWALVLLLAVARRRIDSAADAQPPAPPTIWHDRWTPPPQPEADKVGAGLFILAYLVPLVAPSALTRLGVAGLSLLAPAANLVVAYVIAIEMTDYGKASLRDPDVTYPWFHAMSARRFQVFELFGRAAPRAFLPAFAGVGAAFLLGRHTLAGVGVVLAYGFAAACLAPPGTRGLYDKLLLIFQNYPGGGDERPAPGRFEISGPVNAPKARDGLVAFGVLAAATAAYALQTLVPSWPAVQRYWFFVTDLPPMDYTAIGLSVLFQGFGAAALARATFHGAYAQILQDRFDDEGGAP
jgi:hypothetical protein